MRGMDDSGKAFLSLFTRLRLFFYWKSCTAACVYSWMDQWVFPEHGNGYSGREMRNERQFGGGL